MATRSGLPLGIPGFSDEMRKDLESALEHLFDNDDLTLVTEIPSNMVMHFIRLDIIHHLLACLDPDQEDEVFDPIEVFQRSFMKYMISRNRQGREEVLKAGGLMREQGRLMGEANA
jgi:hypothetical protein